MKRCIQLAANGRGAVKSNPLVGAVIVHNSRIIGEGYHRKYGGPHAEVNAIRSVKDESLLAKSTMYVNLEPCSHYGKTPPCAELIVRKGIPRVVIGCLDPFPEVAGRGVEQLEKAGVDVVVGLLEQEAFALNRAFMTAHQRKRPYVILKWAQSADGFIDKERADASTPAVVLSSPDSTRRVHKLRSEVSTILVGTRTALLDNPSLTARHWAGESPIRVALDRTLSIPSSYNLLDGSVPTLIFTSEKQEIPEKKKNVDYIPIHFEQNVVQQLLEQLYKRNLTSLLVEGGSTLHNQFIQENLWDEMRIETTSVLLHQGIPAPDISGIPPSDGSTFLGNHRLIINTRDK